MQLVCGQLDDSLCVGEVDGSVLANPVDCKPEGGLARTFLYCLNEIPVAAICAADTFFDEALATCVSGDGNEASVRSVVLRAGAAYPCPTLLVTCALPTDALSLPACRRRSWHPPSPGTPP